MSADNVRLRVRVGANEIEIEASSTLLSDAINTIPGIMKLLPSDASAARELQTSSPPNGELVASYLPVSQPRSQTTIPEIKVERDDSLGDLVIKIFKNSWGRQPRKLSQIREVLDSYGLIYPKQSVAVALLRLAQSGRLRRFKGEGGEFVYTASNVLGEASPASATGKD